MAKQFSFIVLETNIKYLMYNIQVKKEKVSGKLNNELFNLIHILLEVFGKIFYKSKRIWIFDPLLSSSTTHFAA